MARPTIEDKKIIAKAQNQVVYWHNELGEPAGRPKYKCKLCKRVFPLDIMEVDHIRPRSRGGVDLPRNLQLLCPSCNKKKGSKVERAGRKPTAKTAGVIKASATTGKRIVKRRVIGKSQVTKKKTTAKRTTTRKAPSSRKGMKTRGGK